MPRTPLYRRPFDCLGLLLALTFALPALLYPPGNDQALHGYVGRGILLGQLPYAHGVSGKPVGIFVAHALSIALFGYNAVAIRALEALCLLPTAFFLVAICRPRGAAVRDGELGSAALLLFGLYYTYFDYWDISHPELFVATLSLWAAHVALNSLQPSWMRCLACGALGGAAFMFKYPAAAMAVPAAAVCGLRAMAPYRSPLPSQSRTSGAGRLLLELGRAAALYVAGVVVVFALAVLPFWLGHAIDPMWEVLYTFTARYVDQAPGLAFKATWLGAHFGGPPLVLACLALALGLLIYGGRRERGALLRGVMLLSLLLSTLLSIWVQKRLFTYHFTVLAPMLAGAVYYGVRSLAKSGAHRLLLPAAAALCLAALVSRPAWSVKPDYNYLQYMDDAFEYVRGALPRERFLAPFVGKNYLDHYAIHEVIGLKIKAQSQKGDEVCARGFAPSIYLVSGLRCPSRHVIQAQPAGLPHWEPEFWHTIAEREPRFVVTFKDRPKDLKRLRRLGYRPQPLPSIYVLMERPPGH